MHNLYKTLAKNTISNFAFKPISTVISLVTFGLLVRLLGLEQYGILMLAAVITGHFSVLNLGISGGLVKFIPEFKVQKEHDKINDAISASLILFSIIGLIVCVAIFLFINLGGIHLFKVNQNLVNSAERVMLIAAIFSLFKWPGTVFSSSLRAFNAYHNLNIVLFLENIFRSAILIVLSYLHVSIDLIFLASNLPRIVSFIIQYFILRRTYPSLLIRINKNSFKTLRHIFSYSIWLLTIQLATVFNHQTDRLIVSFLLGVEMLPVYAVIKRPAGLISDVCATFKKSVIPIASELYAANGLKGVKELVLRGSRLGNAIYASFACILILLLEPLVRLWVGEEFVAYVWVAKIACFFQLFNLTKFFLNTAAKGVSMIIRFQGIFAIISSILYLGLCIVMIQYYGIEGAIFAYIIASVIMAPIWYFYIFKSMELSITNFLKEGTVKGQFVSWILLVVILPLSPFINKISSWVELGILGFFLLLIFYTATWLFCVENAIKERVRQYLKPYLEKINLL